MIVKSKAIVWGIEGEVVIQLNPDLLADVVGQAINQVNTIR
jgi:hypothetical protein